MNEQASRPRPQLIYERVREDAEDELARPAHALAFSGLFAGFSIDATPLAVAVTLSLLDARRQLEATAQVMPAYERPNMSPKSPRAGISAAR